MKPTIFVQLESFFDANYLKDLTYGENPVPNFERLKETCSSGLFYVPSIGAGTANTEFEVLSGMNLDHFGVGEYPYMTTVNKVTTESVATVLRELGYATHAIHNNNATFYDRNIVYSNLFTGVHGNYLKPSIVAAGMDPDNLPVSDPSKMNFGTDASGERNKPKAWKEIWGSGQGIGSIDKISSTADFVAQLKREYAAARDRLKL